VNFFKKRLLKNVLFWVVLVAILLAFIPVDYYLIQPGSADSLEEVVTVEGVEKRDGVEEGKFYMVTVSQKPATLFWLIYGILDPNTDVLKKERVIPPEMDPGEYHNLMKKYMQESQTIAEVVAFRRAGYQVEVTSDGVEIVQLTEDSPALGILQPGDIIVSVDGNQVQLTDQVIQLVQQHEIGEEVSLEIERQGQRLSFVLPTVPHTDDPEKAALQVYIQTKNWTPKLPRNINIATGGITGPSAGMMFTLEILDQLDPADLTGGRQVAGTGTISLDETVGAIGGVRQKVVAAAKEGAEFFLVPRENYDEARKVKTAIELIPVDNLEDALTFLKSLNEKNGGLSTHRLKLL